MSEDEEFRIVEERKRQEDIRKRADLESKKFIDSLSAHGVATLSIRKAFEYGYRYGYDDASRKK